MGSKRHVRAAIGAILASALLPGCGGGSSTQTVQSIPAAPSAPLASAQVSIKVPLGKRASSAQRRPQFVSPATQSVDVTVGAQSPVSFNVAATSPNCSFPVVEGINAYQPAQLALATDGTMWFGNSGGSVGHIAPGGTLLSSPIVATNTITGSQDAIISVGAGTNASVWAGHYYGNPYFSIAHAGYTLSPQYQNISITPPGYLSSEVLGADGNMYFSYRDETDPNIAPAATIGRIVGAAYDASNSWTAASGVARMMPGTDGSIWFTEVNGNVGHLTFPGPVLHEISTGSSGVMSAGVPVYDQIGLAVDPGDGSVYFPKFSTATPLTNSGLGHLDNAGNPLSTIALPPTVGPIYGLAVGADGAIWIAPGIGAVGRVTTSGQYTAYPTPAGNAAASGNSTVLDVATGSDANLYFAERTGGFVGYVEPALQCSGSVPAPTGTSIPVTVKTYDLPGGSAGGGHVLGVVNTTATINPNATNNLTFVLGGVLTSVSVTGTAPTCLETSTLSVNGRDADNNIILGPGSFSDASGNALTVTLSRTAGSATIASPTTFTQSGSTTASTNSVGGSNTFTPSVSGGTISGSLTPAVVNFPNCS